MFNYRHYRAIGNFYCPHCGLKSKTGDFIGTKLDFDKREMLVKEKDGEFKYPLVSDTIFNAFNIMAIITLFRTIGYSPEVIAEHIKHIKLPENRVACEDLGKIKMYTFSAKGQNVSAASTVFEYLAKEPSKKELILLLDEHYGDDPNIETITWLYETDFEYLKNENIKKIIVAGQRYLDYKLRLRLAGIPVEKTVCVFDEQTIPDYVSTDGIESIYVLHDVTTVLRAKKIKVKIKEKITNQ